eukprot:4609234-Prorocentrum_lima.AAC.1
MTSSLVGSEMCIRDSCRHLENVLQDQICCFFTGHFPGNAAPRRASAVSYTHLTLPTICSV